MRYLFVPLGYFLLFASICTAQVSDPLDSFSSSTTEHLLSSDNLDGKSADALIEEATYLLYYEDRPLDARTRLIRALKLSPEDYRPHVLLSEYYLDQVGHYKLSLRYALRATELFQKKSGGPPYFKKQEGLLHSHLLYLLSQIRLNLDEYESALKLLDEHIQRGYTNNWFAGSRAWVLMKLGRLDEAEKDVRDAISEGVEPGRNMNVLGIILSMKDRRQDSIEIFKQAVEYELSQGGKGHPATPLNNMGEVYNEIFEEAQAENAWSRAKSMPDGCEHVLPSLNLSMLYMAQARYDAAEEALNSFESCYAQYPLKNGEEHRALVHLARGRIDLRRGKVDSAIDHLERALSRQQWFGKIGTSTADLQTAAMTALAMALEASNAHLKLRLSESVIDIFPVLAQRGLNTLRATWLKRRARQILGEDLDNFEDLYIRNTDSLLEYSSLGSLLKDFWPNRLARRIASEKSRDRRVAAQLYYDAYLAESTLKHSGSEAALPGISSALSKARIPGDTALKRHLMLLELSALNPDSEPGIKLALALFNEDRAALRNAGLRLPVRVPDDSTARLLAGSAFLPVSPDRAPAEVSLSKVQDRYRALFSYHNLILQSEGKSEAEAVNSLADKVYDNTAP